MGHLHHTVLNNVCDVVQHSDTKSIGRFACLSREIPEKAIPTHINRSGFVLISVPDIELWSIRRSLIGSLGHVYPSRAAIASALFLPDSGARQLKGSKCALSILCGESERNKRLVISMRCTLVSRVLGHASPRAQRLLLGAGVFSPISAIDFLVPHEVTFRST